MLAFAQGSKWRRFYSPPVRHRGVKARVSAPRRRGRRFPKTSFGGSVNKAELGGRGAATVASHGPRHRSSAEEERHQEPCRRRHRVERAAVLERLGHEGV